MVWEYTHVTYHVKLKLDGHLVYGGKCSVTTLQSIQKRSSKREEPEVNNPMQISTKVNLGISHPLLYASLPSQWFSKKCYKCPRQQKR